MSLVFVLPSLFPIIAVVSVMVISVVARRIISVRMALPVITIDIIFFISIFSDLVNFMSAKSRRQRSVVHDGPGTIKLRGSVPVSLVEDVVIVVVVKEIVG